MTRRANQSISFFWAFLQVDLSNFCRNKTAAFWTFAFPLLLLVIFMGSFGSGAGLTKIALRFDDQDKSSASLAFIEHTHFIFSSQDSIKVAFVEAKLADTEELLTVVIPKGFKRQLEAHQGAVLRLSSNAPTSLSSDIAGKILSSAADDFVLRQLYEFRGISLTSTMKPLKAKPATEVSYAAYLVTGLLCMVVISTSLMGFVIPLVSSRQSGNFRIFELIPASKLAVVLALAMSKFIVILVSGILLFVFGASLYELGLPVELSRYANGLLVLIVGVMGFLALALVVAARVQTSDWANIICNMIYFPLILLGNLFIPIESGNTLAQVLDQMPVNLFVKALRGTLLSGEPLSSFSHFFVLFGVMILFSLGYSSRAFVLNRGVQSA